MLRLSLLLPLLLAAVFCAPALRGETVPAPLSSDSVIYPRNSPEARHAQAESESASSVWGMLGVIAVLAAGGFYLVKRGGLRTAGSTHVRQRLAIEETRPLGNKQFLAVAAYGERKLLLAVCPGRIDLLCRLDDSAPATESRGAESVTVVRAD